MTVSNSSPLDELRKAVIDQKKANLPFEPADPSLTSLHQAVVTYDQLVSQLVIGAIQGIDFNISNEQVRQAAGEVNQLLDSPEWLDNRKAQFYRSYKARLDRMFDLVVQMRGGA